MWSSPRDNWERLVAAVVKRDEIWQLCHQDCINTATTSSRPSDDYRAEILSISSNRWKRISVSPPRPQPLTTASVLEVSNSWTPARSITQKLLSVWYGRRKGKDQYSVDLPDDVAIHLERVRRFSLEELRVATKNFKHARNQVYRGWLADGSTVAVKRFKCRGSSASTQLADLQNEVIINSITAHPNFLGYCIAPKKCLLVFRLMANPSPSSGLRGQLQEFSMEILLKATDDFSEEFKIGCNNFGSVYHATLDDGRQVAIKRDEFSVERDMNNKLLKELEFLSRLNHNNFVGLLGYCKESKEHVLVYEYMENGTLFDHLHSNHIESKFIMPWSKRIKVALDVARGIEYLHDYAVPRVIHRDIKSSNILLDATWTAKLAGFGLESSYLSTAAADTIDPECYGLNVLTAKNDVYSVGIVLLELLSGCEGIHHNEAGVPINLVDYAATGMLKNEIDRVLDRRVSPPTPLESGAVAHMGCLAADCVLPERRDRPTMTHVVATLEKALAACVL